MLQENVFYDIPLRKHTWFYLKIKSEKQSSLRVRLVWKAVFQIMEKPAAIVKNLSLLQLLETSTEIAPFRVDEGAWQFPLVQHKPGIHLPGFCLFISSISAIQMGKSTCDSICVWFGAADGCEWQTVACVGTYLEMTQSPASVCCCAAPALPYGRGHCQGSCIWSPTWLDRDPMQASRFQCWCLFVTCLLSKKAQTVLKII